MLRTRLPKDKGLLKLEIFKFRRYTKIKFNTGHRLFRLTQYELFIKRKFRKEKKKKL